MQREKEKKKKEFIGGVNEKTLPISATVHKEQHWHVWRACLGLYSGDLQRSFHRSVLLHHVRIVSSISSLESGRLAIFFRDLRWHSDSRSLLAESRMAVRPWIVEREEKRRNELKKSLQSYLRYIRVWIIIVRPAWFPLPGGAAAGWRWCVRSETGRWCSCPWCYPADPSGEAWWGRPPWGASWGLWTPTTTPAPTPVWCRSTGSEDTAWSQRRGDVTTQIITVLQKHLTWICILDFWVFWGK